jgi:hypothetical protein
MWSLYEHPVERGAKENARVAEDTLGHTVKMAKGNIKHFMVPVYFIVDAQTEAEARAKIEGVLTCADEAEINVWRRWCLVEDLETAPISIQAVEYH